jgi:hypothetical protein
MKRLAVLVISFVMLFNLAEGGETKVPVDDNHIQEYRGLLGKWVLIESPGTLYFYAKKFSSPVRDVYKINSCYSMKDILGNYVFIPYSEEYLVDLKSQGITRKMIVSNHDQFIWPIEEVIEITSVLGLRWGRFHPGIDMPAPTGTPVYASKGGMVLSTVYAGGYGLTVEIEHRNNYTTKYAHLSVMFVKKGEFVKKGQLIALVGTTGNSTGPHLHFEIRSNDIPLDPLDFLPRRDSIKILHTLKNWK